MTSPTYDAPGQPGRSMRRPDRCRSRRTVSHRGRGRHRRLRGPKRPGRETLVDTADRPPGTAAGRGRRDRRARLPGVVPGPMGDRELLRQLVRPLPDRDPGAGPIRRRPPRPGRRDSSPVSSTKTTTDQSETSSARRRITWPLLSYAGIDSANAFGVAGIPVTFLVRPGGRSQPRSWAAFGPASSTPFSPGPRPNPRSPTQPWWAAPQDDETTGNLRHFWLATAAPIAPGQRRGPPACTPTRWGRPRRWRSSTVASTSPSRRSVMSGTVGDPILLGPVHKTSYEENGP